MSRGPAVPRRHRLHSGLELALLSWPGAGPTMVLLHPNRTNARVWDFVVAASELPNPVLAIEHRGHGDSDWPDDGYELQDYVDDDIEVIESVADGPVILAGAATGGNIALLLASQRPDLVAATIVVDPGLSLDPAINARVQSEIDEGYVFADREAAVASMPFSELWTDHVHAHFGYYSFRDLPDGRVAGRYHQRAAQVTETALERDLWDEIDLRCPLLALRGDRSEVFDRPRWLRLAEQVPSTILAEVPRADHRVTQDNPRACAQLIDAFVRGLGLDRAGG